MPSTISRKPFRPLSHTDALDFLALAYRQGRLVPFIGSGLSAGTLPGWMELIKRLAKRPVSLKARPSEHDLIRASESVVARLRGQGRNFGKEVREALGSGATTAATTALSSVWWPLVLTTNYDHMFRDEFNRKHGDEAYRKKRGSGCRPVRSMVVVGRGRSDCQTVVTSLNTPTRPLLWALQGFLEETSDGRGLAQESDGRDLAQEIVLGYEQYREATFHNPDFRAAFMEVFRNRSLLFIGSGLSEEYFRGLFGESLVRLGPGQQAHWALVNNRDVASGKVDRWFLHTRLNIMVVTYYDKKGKKFNGFAPAVSRICRALPSRTRYPSRIYAPGKPRTNVSIELSASSLPANNRAKSHWVVISAGKDSPGGRERLSEDARSVANATKDWKVVVTTKAGATIARSARKRILKVVARQAGQPSGRARDLRSVAELTTEALRLAARRHASTISMMFLAADPLHARWPRVFSLVQMLRGIRRFLDHRTAKRPLQIHIYDTTAADGRDVSAWQAVQSGRLDPQEILDCRAVRFFVEIEDDDAVRRTPTYDRDDNRIAEVADYFRLGKGWLVQIDPQPYTREEPLAATSNESLAEAGVVPGSTIRFYRASVQPTAGR